MKTRMFPMTAALFAYSSAALLCGCAPTHLIFHAERNGVDGTGLVQQQFVQPYPIQVTLDGQIYVGKWRSQKAPDHPLANSYLYKRHVGRVVTTLTNREGKHLHCNWLIKGLRGAGTCEDERKIRFNVTIG